jgi:hypothetical protein
MRKQNIILLLSLFLLAGLVLISSCKKDNGGGGTYTTDKSALNALIDSVNTILSTTAEGNKPGEYAVGSKEILDSIVQLATDIAASDSYTQQQVDNANDNLERAVTTFNSPSCPLPDESIVLPLNFQNATRLATETSCIR